MRLRAPNIRQSRSWKLQSRGSPQCCPSRMLGGSDYWPASILAVIRPTLSTPAACDNIDHLRYIGEGQVGIGLHEHYLLGAGLEDVGQLAFRFVPG